MFYQVDAAPNGGRGVEFTLSDHEGKRDVAQKKEKAKSQYWPLTTKKI